jgi:glycosyltransferase involved in cell wall biosynthesis
MKLSIALATYNGERFLRQQLDSYAAQDRPPDEVVACDDLSSDRTLEILAEFAAEAPFLVSYRRNERQLGVMKNFEAAVALCTGDVVFFSDQDDIWLPGKLARHEAVYRDEPDVGVIFGDATVVDEGLKPTGQTLFDYAALTSGRRGRIEGKHAFGLLIRRAFAYGCTMSFRSEFLAPLRPFPYEFMHDHWVQTVLATRTRFRTLPEPLMLYRQHAAQTVGINHDHDADPSKRRRDHVEQSLKAMEYLLAHLDSLGEGGRAFRNRTRARIAHLRRRDAIGDGVASGALTIARELLTGAYNRYGEYPLSELRSDLRQWKSARP